MVCAKAVSNGVWRRRAYRLERQKGPFRARASRHENCNTKIAIGEKRYAHYLEYMSLINDLAYRAGATAKLAFYGAHYGMSRAMSAPFVRPGDAPFVSDKPMPDRKAISDAFMGAFIQDRHNIADGLYLAPDARDQVAQTTKSLAYLRDVRAIDKRRLAGKGTEVRDDPASEGFPAYFRQNFHWQSGGWLTPESAELYDFQVETIFTGSAGAMRRATALALFAQSLKGLDHRSLVCAEIACGTGQFALETLRNFPRLDLTAFDMSPAYAQKARQSLQAYKSARVVTGAAEAMPFCDASLDRAVCIYLFHELPPKIRKAVAVEAARVIKKGGQLILADAIQEGDDANLDRMLEAFPIGFHEPFFTSWLTTDTVALFEAAGFKLVDTRLAFLTKAWAFERV
jgi:ubiquinone/menaquinone biosynthesis C-methylase UbiE